ncbi:MAG: hypothetical protein WCQ49_01395 [Candidatus Saccharibacteria bacterium]
MALIKIYSEPRNDDQLPEVAKSIKQVCSKALDCPEVPTSPNQIETVKCTGIDLVGIDYIFEVICCKRPNMQQIGDSIISGLNAIYPETLFSVYFNIIEEDGMASTPRNS